MDKSTAFKQHAGLYLPSQTVLFLFQGKNFMQIQSYSQTNQRTKVKTTSLAKILTTENSLLPINHANDIHLCHYATRYTAVTWINDRCGRLIRLATEFLNVISIMLLAAMYIISVFSVELFNAYATPVTDTSRHCTYGLGRVGWLVFNGTFSTKKAILCHAKNKSLLKILNSDRNLKYVV